MDTLSASTEVMDNSEPRPLGGVTGYGTVEWVFELAQSEVALGDWLMVVQALADLLAEWTENSTLVAGGVVASDERRVMFELDGSESLRVRRWS